MDVTLTEGNLGILNDKEKTSDIMIESNQAENITNTTNMNSRSNIDFENFNKNFGQFNENIEKSIINFL